MSFLKVAFDHLSILFKYAMIQSSLNCGFTQEERI